MSIQAVGWALAQTVGSSTAKAVLVAVSNYADETGRCWPSQQKLALDTELSERAIRNALAFLEERGFITREPRRRQDGSRSADTIHVICQPAYGSKQPAPDAGSQPAPRSKQPAPGAPPPAPGAGLTTFEPSGNHHEPSRARAIEIDPIAKLKIDIVKSFVAAKSTTLAPDTHRAETWIAQGYDPSIILATVRELLARKPNVTTLAYFDRSIAEAHEKRAPKALAPKTQGDMEATWSGWLRLHASDGYWHDSWGDPPGHPGCKIPRAFIEANRQTRRAA